MGGFETASNKIEFIENRQVSSEPKRPAVCVGKRFHPAIPFSFFLDLNRQINDIPAIL
jgi:hypothetical protein